MKTLFEWEHVTPFPETDGGPWVVVSRWGDRPAWGSFGVRTELFNTRDPQILEDYANALLEAAQVMRKTNA